MKQQTKVTIFNEFIHERNEARIREIYPQGIHGAIAESSPHTVIIKSGLRRSICRKTD